MPKATRSTNLPDFERPPVNEVYLSAQFEPLVEIVVDQCEFSSTNHMLSGSGWDTHADAPAVFSFLRKPRMRDPLAEAEDEQCRLRFVLRSVEGEPIGL